MLLFGLSYPFELLFVNPDLELFFLYIITNVIRSTMPANTTILMTIIAIVATYIFVISFSFFACSYYVYRIPQHFWGKKNKKDKIEHAILSPYLFI